MQKFTINLFIAALMFICSSASAQSAFSILRTDPHQKKNNPPAEYQRVKIWLDGKPSYELARLGLDLTEGDYRKNVWFTSDFDRKTINKIRNAGFRIEVLIEDVKSFYKNRNESSARLADPITTQSVACGTFTPSYPVPVNFHHGSMGGFYTYSELLSVIDSMALLYPNLVTVKAPIDVIQSIEGNDIYFIKLSDNPNTDEAEPEVLYSALHHAREPESVTQMVYYLWYLLENYASDPEIQALVDNTEMYFIPCLNPDGYMYNEATDPNGGGMWRKNRRNNLDGEYGVDLNRNYGYNWGYDDNGSSPYTIDETYRGTSAFSEPETQAIRNFTNNRQFRLALNYHTHGNHMVIPWGHIPYLLTPDSASFDFYGHAICKYNRYHVGTGFVTVGYVTNGNSDDWMYGEQSSKAKIFSMTPEVGDVFDGFWPDQSRINYLSESNVFANLTMAKLAGRYGTVTHEMPRYTGNINNQLNYNFQQLGLDTTATYTISLLPITSNIISVGSPVVHSMVGGLQIVSDSISFTLDPGTSPGDLIQYIVRIDNGWYADDDTVTQLFGHATIALSDDCSDLGNWNSSGTWDATTEDYTSAPSSITDFPYFSYQSNDNNSIELTNLIDLTDAVDAIMTYNAKWEIERGYDYVQVSASGDGGSTWNPLCGKYTVTGTAQQVFGEPLYDGNTLDWVEEEVSLNDYLGQNILIRFHLVSDGFAEYNGFFFDDFKIEYIDSTGLGIRPLAAHMFLSHPVPNPSGNEASINYHNVAAGSNLVIYNVYGQLVYKQQISGTGKMTIPTQQFSKGMYSYFVQLTDGSVSNAMKLIRN